MSTDDRALSAIINATREATRSQRQSNANTIMSATRTLFRPMHLRSGSERLIVRGRRRTVTWRKNLFLLRRANTDFYPGRTECTFLEDNGLGRKVGIIERHWSINRLQRYICQSYPLIPLEDTGFRYGKCSRDKRIIILPAFNTINEIEREVGRSSLLIIPNRDLELGQYVERSDTILSTGRNETSGNSNSRYEYSDDSDFDIPSTSQRAQAIGPRNAIIRRETNEENPSFTTATSDGAQATPRNAIISRETIEENSSFASVISDDDIYDENSNEVEVSYPEVLSDDIFTIEINRGAILSQLLEIYKDEALVLKKVNVVFKNEIGLDYGGLTKELYTEFWKQCRAEYFRGEDSVIPYLPLSRIRRGQGEYYIIIGRILAHTLLLTKTIPTFFAKSFYLFLGDLDRKIEESILQDDFLHFLSYSERLLVKKAEKAFQSLTNNEKEILLELFQTYGLLENPKEEDISQQIITIAENLIAKESRDLIKKIRDGIPIIVEDFFINLTIEKLTAIYKKEGPTPAKLVKCLETSPEELNNVQSRTLYFFKTYIGNLSPLDLAKFLLFVTSSEHMPEKVTVHLKNNGLPVADTCSNLLELPVTYNTYQEMKHQFDAILNNDNSFQYTIL